MTKTGTVSKLQAGGFAAVSLDSASCGGECRNCGGCFAQTITVTARNPNSARVGERVTVYTPPNSVAVCVCALLAPFAVLAVCAVTLSAAATGCVTAAAAAFSFILLKRLKSYPTIVTTPPQTSKGETR